MGTVWAADQTQPVRRKVALKLIKPRMDSRQMLARFEAERQALALMDHPDIARVFDAGTIEASRPFFVVDYVRGVPITEYWGRPNSDIGGEFGPGHLAPGLRLPRVLQLPQIPVD
jgi:serine/threonine protein kinase